MMTSTRSYNVFFSFFGRVRVSEIATLALHQCCQNLKV